MKSPNTTIHPSSLERIEILLESLVASMKRFEQFVLEVSPEEAKVEIATLEKEL